MANSLLPDLSKDIQKSNAAKIIAEFDYDNTNSEVDSAMRTFQYKFSSKRGILAIVAYSLLLVAAVVMAILNPTMYPVYAAIIVCAGGLFLSLTAKKRLRKKVIQALDSMDPETYHCSLFDDKIEIETNIRANVIIDKMSEDSENEEISSMTEVVPDEIKPIKSVFKFKEDMLDFAENRDCLMLVVARRQFYCFPKRCLTEEQQNIVREHLSEKTQQFFN